MVKRILQKVAKKMGYKLVPAKTNMQEAQEKLSAAFGMQIDPVKYAFCYKHHRLLLALQNKLGASISFDKDGTFIISFGDMRFNITAADEIFIIYEVFIKGTYNYAGNEDFILVDIGMNVGTTCLYFSRMEYCKKVVAFEPFEKTILAAKRNYELNKSVSSKIEINPVGLGYPARTLEVKYAEQEKGSTGIHGVADYVNNAGATETAILQIADAYESLKPVIENSAYKKIIKIDCEGAEYEILRRLQETNSIAAFDAYMIEWHLEGPKEIVALLVANGFHVHSIDEYEQHIGMVYAYKK